MKSVIKEMYWDMRGHYSSVKLSEEYNEEKNKLFSAIEKFMQKLTPELQKEFNEVIDFSYGQSAEYAADHYYEGLKLGLLIGIEAVKEN